jgi:putative mycofactocin binding protein MftB
MPPLRPEAVTNRFDASQPWALHPQVSLRPESCGALAYHFGTRRLTFLKSRTLLAVVESLGDHPTGREACRSAGVSDPELGQYEQALATLADSGMICPRVAS